MSEHFGIYQGSVLNNNDPERRGRIICLIPQVLGDSGSEWCEPMLPTVYKPKVNEIVWVQFINGDPARPVYQSRVAVTSEIVVPGSITEDNLAFDPADGILTTYYQDDPPDSPANADLWYDTSVGQEALYRWNGTLGQWQRILDADVVAAAEAAADAQSTADTKVVTFAQATQPTATGIGDLWVDTDDGNKTYRWNGTTWVALPVGSGALTADAINGKTITGATVQTSDLANRGVKLENTGIRAWTSSGVETFKVNAADGLVTLRGINVIGTEDVGTATVTPGNEPPVRVGTLLGVHTRWDGNEVQAMSDGDSPGTFLINQGGGDVTIAPGGGDVTVGGSGSDVTIGAAATSVVTALSLIKAGERTINITSTETIFTATVNFGTPFPAGSPMPNIVVTANVLSPQLFHVSHSNVTKSGFDMHVYKSGSGSTGNFDFHWVAVAT